MKEYLVSWTDVNGCHHNGTFYSKNLKELREQFVVAYGNKNKITNINKTF